MASYSKSSIYYYTSLFFSPGFQKIGQGHTTRLIDLHFMEMSVRGLLHAFQDQAVSYFLFIDLAHSDNVNLRHLVTV